MAKWLLVLLAAAALTWWATRPAAGRRAERRNIKMNRCPRCGVYVEAGGDCRCQDGKGGA